MGQQRGTKYRKRRFLDAVARGSNVQEAADWAGVHRATPYEWSKGDPGFEELWLAAERVVMGSLRRKAYDLAMGGNVRLIMWLLERETVVGAEGAGVDGAVERAGSIEIIDRKEGVQEDGEFIEFVEA